VSERMIRHYEEIGLFPPAAPAATADTTIMVRTPFTVGYLSPIDFEREAGVA